MQDQSRVVSVFGGFRRDNQTLRVEIMKLFIAVATPQHSGIIGPGEIKFTTWLCSISCTLCRSLSGRY